MLGTETEIEKEELVREQKMWGSGLDTLRSLWNIRGVWIYAVSMQRSGGRSGGSAGVEFPWGALGVASTVDIKGKRPCSAEKGLGHSQPQASQKVAQGLGCRGLPSGGTSRCGLEQGFPQTDVAPVGGRVVSELLGLMGLQVYSPASGGWRSGLHAVWVSL